MIGALVAVVGMALLGPLVDVSAVSGGWSAPVEVFGPALAALALGLALVLIVVATIMGWTTAGTAARAAAGPTIDGNPGAQRGG